RSKLEDWARAILTAEKCSAVKDEVAVARDVSDEVAAEAAARFGTVGAVVSPLAAKVIEHGFVPLFLPLSGRRQFKDGAALRNVYYSAVCRSSVETAIHHDHAGLGSAA